MQYKEKPCLHPYAVDGNKRDSYRHAEKTNKKQRQRDGRQRGSRQRVRRQRVRRQRVRRQRVRRQKETEKGDRNRQKCA